MLLDPSNVVHIPLEKQPLRFSLSTSFIFITLVCILSITLGLLLISPQLYHRYHAFYEPRLVFINTQSICKYFLH